MNVFSSTLVAVWILPARTGHLVIRFCPVILARTLRSLSHQSPRELTHDAPMAFLWLQSFPDQPRPPFIAALITPTHLTFFCLSGGPRTHTSSLSHWRQILYSRLTFSISDFEQRRILDHFLFRSGPPPQLPLRRALCLIPGHGIPCSIKSG